MSYAIVIDPYADKQVAKLNPRTRAQVFAALRNLKDNPRPGSVKKLVGYQGGWRIRIGKYRALYFVDDAASTVTVFDVDLRDKVYKLK